MTIAHLSTIEDLNWPNSNLIHNPKTLILGSLNPYNPNLQVQTDFYYGRKRNYLWKGIAFNLELPLNYFFIYSDGLSPLEKKIKCMQDYKFCFLDLIDGIKYESANQNILDKYISSKIFKGFGDDQLFRNDIFNYNGNQIIKKLIFNKEILNKIKNGNFSKIIHTLGNNRINENFKISHNESQNFINQILNITNNNSLNFNTISYSPSQYAVHFNGQVFRNNLFSWIREKILNL